MVDPDGRDKPILSNKAIDPREVRVSDWALSLTQPVAPDDRRAWAPAQPAAEPGWTRLARGE
jgi:hypothetical protein